MQAAEQAARSEATGKLLIGSAGGTAGQKTQKGRGEPLILLILRRGEVCCLQSAVCGLIRDYGNWRVAQLCQRWPCR